MKNYKLEFIWLDGYSPVANMRSKTKIMEFDNFNGELEKIPEWNFDGSSTQQADGGKSDCVLKPVNVYLDPDRSNAYLVIAEVYNVDSTPHQTNTRCKLEKTKEDFWFGFEQEYVLMNDAGRPIGFPTGGYPEPQGPYYCAVGYQYVAGRNIVEEHLDSCLDAGIGITGMNAEVMLGQWEFQIFGSDIKACDDLMIARYLLFRISEKHQVRLELHPKPITGDWNGSGMHTNFSYNYLRETGGEGYLYKMLDEYGKFHKEHLAEYGSDNEMRLTGKHETGSIDKFSYGISDRGASIRIPVFTVSDNYKGYLEDRRPASNADPYRIAARIIKSVRIAHDKALG